LFYSEDIDGFKKNHNYKVIHALRRKNTSKG